MSRSSLVLPVAALVATPVSLQASETPAGVIGEIVVTAQKRASSVQDVPFSVAAQTEEQIRNSGAGNVVEFARNVAGLTVADLGPGQSQVAIRGISAGQVVRDQPGVKEQVGIYLDESPISVALFTPDLELFDLERIEVLRGPQGTLFGAGSTAGTLRYITAQPRSDRMEGTMEVAGQTLQDGGSGGAVRGAVNVPLGDSSAARLVGYHNEIPGFIDAVGPGGSIRKDVNGGYKRGGRATLLINPSERVTITPRLVYQELQTDGYPRIDIYNILANPYTTTQPPVTLGEREQFIQLKEGLEDDFMLADLKVDVDLGAVSLTAISSYTDRDIIVGRDLTQLTGSVTFDIGGTADEVRIDSPLTDATTLEAFSQELRLSSNSEGPLAWLVGAFYQRVDRKYGQTLTAAGYDEITQRLFGVDSGDFGAPADTPFMSRLTYDFEQLGLFGEGTYRFDEHWALTAGLRYYDFDERRDLYFGGFFSDPSVNGPGATSSDGFSPRVILSFAVSDDLQLNAQVARGFRLGGINDPLNLSLCSPEDAAIFGGRDSWQDEKVLNYELGAKASLADGRALLNVATFYSQIDDLQANADAGSCSSRIVFNAEARSVGGELELFVRPHENWDLGLSATYVQAEITSTQPDANGNPIAGLRAGNRLPTAPELQASASLGYVLPLGMTRELFATLTLQHIGSSYSQIAHQVPDFSSFVLRQYGGPLTQPTFTFDPELPSYEIGNLRLGVRNDTWEVAAFVNNLWDERAFLSVDTERGRGARVAYLTNAPRSFGLSMRMKF